MVMRTDFGQLCMHLKKIIHLIFSLHYCRIWSDVCRPWPFLCKIYTGHSFMTRASLPFLILSCHVQHFLGSRPMNDAFLCKFLVWLFWQIAFACVVFPCLLLAYMGQAAYLTQLPDSAERIFYDSVPGELSLPSVGVLLLCSPMIPFLQSFDAHSAFAYWSE